MGYPITRRFRPGMVTGVDALVNDYAIRGELAGNVERRNTAEQYGYSKPSEQATVNNVSVDYFILVQVPTSAKALNLFAYSPAATQLSTSHKWTVSLQYADAPDASTWTTIGSVVLDAVTTAESDATSLDLYAGQWLRVSLTKSGSPNAEVRASFEIKALHEVR